MKKGTFEMGSFIVYVNVLIVVYSSDARINMWEAVWQEMERGEKGQAGHLPRVAKFWYCPE